MRFRKYKYGSKYEATLKDVHELGAFMACVVYPFVNEFHDECTSTDGEMDT